MKRSMIWLAMIAVGLVASLGNVYGLGYRPLSTANNDRTGAAPLVVDNEHATTAPATVSSAGAGQAGATIDTVIADAKMVPVASADLGFSANGVVAEIAMYEGSVVTAGQRLVQLDTRDALVAVAQDDIVYRATLALAQPDPRLRWNMTAAVIFTQAER